jgi:hypothetical protein
VEGFVDRRNWKVGRFRGQRFRGQTELALSQKQIRGNSEVQRFRGRGFVRGFVDRRNWHFHKSRFAVTQVSWTQVSWTQVSWTDGTGTFTKADSR